MSEKEYNKTNQKMSELFEYSKKMNEFYNYLKTNRIATKYVNSLMKNKHERKNKLKFNKI